MNDLEKKQLLENYAPVLRFSAGERFFPMKVDHYISDCEDIYVGKKRKIDWKQVEDKLNYLKTSPERDLNLHFLRRGFWSFWFLKIVLTIIVLMLTSISVYGMWNLELYFHDEFLRRNTPHLLHVGLMEKFKIGLLAFGIIVLPLFNADRKVHLAVLLNVFGIFFFGTLFAFGFGVVAFAVIIGFWAVFGVFKLGFGKKNVPLSGLHGISLLLITLSSGIIGIVLDLLIVSHNGFSIVLPTATFVFYALLWISPLLPKQYSNEWKSIILLSLAILVIAGVYVVGKQQNWNFIFLYVAMISISGISLLWYALDPLPVTRPGLLLEDNKRQAIFAWDFKILFFITLDLIIFTALSWWLKDFTARSIDESLEMFLLWLGMIILHGIVSVINLGLTFGIVGFNVASYILDTWSPLENSDANLAKSEYNKIIKQLPDPAKPYQYYGRVCHQNDWVILQYQYFYAFNDWRSNAGGMNNHEGDWEAVSIFLRRKNGAEPIPFGVAYSQHHHGVFRFWDDVKKVKPKDNVEPTHPLVYVALGSHANYPEPGIYPPSVQFSGKLRRVIAEIEKAIRAIRSGVGLVDKLMTEYDKKLDEFHQQKSALEKFEREREMKGLDTTASSDEEHIDSWGLDHNKNALYATGVFLSKIAAGADWDSGAVEYAAGDGVRVGCISDDYSDECRFAVNLPGHIEWRESNVHGEAVENRNVIFADWQYETIDDTRPWVCYKGLWGQLTGVEGENGPQGPKWDKNEKRIRWGGRDQAEKYYLEWLDTLLLDIVQDEDQPTDIRRKAFQYLAER